MITRHCAYFCCCICFGIKNINVTTGCDQIHQLFHKILSINIILKSIKGHNSVEKFGKIMCVSHNMDHIYWAEVINQLCYLFSVACIKIIISPKQKFSQPSIFPHNGFNNLFPTVQETNHFMEVGWLKKNEMHGDVSVSDMRHAFCAS